MAHLKILKRLETLEKAYAELMAKHIEVVSQNEKLRLKVSRLEAKLSSQKVKKDSTNSSIPPSQAPLRKKNTSLRKPSGQKPGGQLGHKGHHLKMVDNPDTIVEHKATVCPKCKGSLQKVLGSDETSAIVNGELHWMWTWQNKMITFLVAASSRGFSIVDQLFEEGLKQCIMVSDRLGTQLKQDVAGKQVCLVHLLRDLKNDIQSSTDPRWLESFQQLLVDVIALNNQIDHTRIADYTQSIHQLRERKDELLQQELPDGTLAYKLQKAMKKVSNYLLTCLYHEEVPPDNNASERALRNVKSNRRSLPCSKA